MDLAGFIDTYRDAIAKRVVESYPPLYRPSEKGQPLPKLLRSPLGAQPGRHPGRSPLPRGPPGHHRRRRDGHRQDLHRPRQQPTWRASAGCWFLCPPHLTRKWKREVEETVPHARAAIVSSITDLERLRTYQGSAPLFAVMSRERAKLSYRLAASRGAPLGQGLGQAGAGRGDGRPIQGAMLPLVSRPSGGQERGAPDPRGDVQAQTHLRGVR